MDRSDIIASVVPSVTSQPVARPPNHECDSVSKDIEAPAIFALARQPKDARRRTRSSIVEVVRSREQLQVWLRDSRRRQLTGTIGIELASDAKRLGQDLVGTLVDRALREAERNRLV
jgi:hypothetical protein